MGIVLDGSFGEGGGQILRTALSLSALTGEGFAIHHVRANRVQPGLRPGHVEAIRAVAQLCDAQVSGAEVGASRVEFEPRAPVKPGDHVVEIGAAGSAPLLLQTLCWPLALAGGPSHLTLRGGTHVQRSPTFHDLALAWNPAMARLGFGFEVALQAAGFYPEGGGEITAAISPAHAMPPLDLRHRGMLEGVEVVAMVAGVPFGVAESLADRACRKLRAIGIAAEATRVPVPARTSSGSYLYILLDFERVRTGFGALGGRGENAERTADLAVSACARFLHGGAAVDRHLADQLVLPLALLAARRVSPPAGIVPTFRYTTASVSKHLVTCAMVVKRFLDVEVAVLGREDEEGEVRVQPPGSAVEVLPLGG